MTRRKVKVKRQPSGPPRGRGRPSEYSVDLADVICQRIADGESLRSICKDRRMPDRSTVFRWLAQKREFRDHYARAREAQADLMFEDILEIADSTSKDVQRDKLRVDARKWVAAKLLPKKYGEHADVLAPGFDDDGKPIVPVINISYEKPDPAVRRENLRVAREQRERAKLPRLGNGNGFGNGKH